MKAFLTRLYSSSNEATTALRVRQCVLLCMCLCVQESESQSYKAKQWGDVNRLQTSDQMPGRTLQLGSWGKSAKLFIGLTGVSPPI